MSTTPLLTTDLNYVLTHSESVWKEMQGQHIFITGGTGFFGRWLLETFMCANERLQLNATAVILTRDFSTFKKTCPHLAVYPRFEFLTGDVRNFAYPKGHFSHIIHAATAASAQLNAQDPLLMLDIITQGTWHMLNFAQRCGAKKFLQISSGAIYGKQPADLLCIPEDYLGAPVIEDTYTAYAQGKRMAEHLALQYARKQHFEVKIARCFAFVGPHLPLDQHFAIGNFIRDARNQGPIKINSNGTAVRSYLYAADLMVWLWNILCHGKNTVAYNVGSEEAFSIYELAKIISGLYSPKLSIEFGQVPQKDNSLGPERYVPSVYRAQTELNLPPKINLVNALERTLEWLLLDTTSAVVK